MVKKIMNHEKAPVFFLMLAVALYWIIFTTLTLWKYHHFYYDNLDLAIFNQVFFNTLHGNFFAATIHPPSYLGDHFSPIIFLLLPFYTLYQHPQTLLVLQTLIIGLTAVPIFFIARHILGTSRDWLSLGIALLWLLNPSVHNMNFFEFELVPFAVFFLFSAFLFYRTENRIGFIIAASAALLVREDIAFIVLFFGILALIEKRKKFWQFLPLAISCIYAAIAFSVIAAFTANGSYKFISYYGWLGGTTPLTIVLSFIMHPLKLLYHFFDFKNIEFILGISFPFLFLVVKRSRYLLLLAAPLAQIWLSVQGGSALILMTHYAGPVLFGLFIIFIEQIQGIEKNNWPRLVPPILRQKNYLYPLILCASVYGSLSFGSLVPALQAWQTDHLQDEKQSLIQQIPSNAAVASTFELLTPLSSRKHIYSLHYGLIGKNQFAQTSYELPADTEYLAIDWQDIVKTQMHFNKHQTFGPLAYEVPGRLRSLMSRFSLVQADGSLTLWKKNNDPLGSPLPVELMKDDTKTRTPAVQPESYEKITNGASVTIALPLVMPAEKKYYLLVRTAEREFMVPLAYGLYQTSELQGYATVTMPVYLKAGELTASVQIYEWEKSYLKLGDLKNLAIVSDAKPVGRSFTLERGK